MQIAAISSIAFRIHFITPNFTCSETSVLKVLDTFRYIIGKVAVDFRAADWRGGNCGRSGRRDREVGDRVCTAAVLKRVLPVFLFA